MGPWVSFLILQNKQIHTDINKNARELKGPGGSREVHAYYPLTIPNPFPAVGDNIGKRRDQGGREADSQWRQKTGKYLVGTTPLLGSENHKLNC